MRRRVAPVRCGYRRDARYRADQLARRAHIPLKYTCRVCETIVQTPAPPKPIARGKATFGTLAHVVVAKLDHHLPPYRQPEMMAAQGIDIDRSTLAGWAGQAAHLLNPIVTRIREEGLRATKIHADDTPVKVLAPGSGKSATGRRWAYVVDDRASECRHPAARLVSVHFQPRRYPSQTRTCHSHRLPPSRCLSRVQWHLRGKQRIRGRMLGAFPARAVRTSQSAADRADHRSARAHRPALYDRGRYPWSARRRPTKHPAGTVAAAGHGASRRAR